MIIKSKSYKSKNSFSTVISYILREQEREQGFVLTKFFKGNDQDAEYFAKQLLINESYRQIKRKNNVKLYMDILSFHAKDSEKLTNEKLQIMALKYLSLRAPKSMAIATVHRNEKDHVHLHICFSGVEYKTGKSIRISKDDFKYKVKIPMEQFQQQRFPELSLSEINHDRSAVKAKDQDLRKDVEKEMELKDRISEKQQILKVLEDTFKTASSEKNFYEQLKSKGVQLYSRNGVIIGIQGQRKFRFKTLGYTQEILAELDKNITLNQRLEILRKLKQNNYEKDKDISP